MACPANRRQRRRAQHFLESVRGLCQREPESRQTTTRQHCYLPASQAHVWPRPTGTGAGTLAFPEIHTLTLRKKRMTEPGSCCPAQTLGTDASTGTLSHENVVEQLRGTWDVSGQLETDVMPNSKDDSGPKTKQNTHLHWNLAVHDPAGCSCMKLLAMK